jgi:hypothetical protein
MRSSRVLASFSLPLKGKEVRKGEKGGEAGEERGRFEEGKS